MAAENRFVVFISFTRIVGILKGNATSGVTRALIGGGCIVIYSCSARRISFEMNLISKEIRRAEHEYMNIHPPN